MRGGGGAFRDPVARAKAERDNDRAAVGERIAAYREAGATWQRAATRECINRDAARVCFALYQRIAVKSWPCHVRRHVH